jgi:hypothetical protein
MGLSDAGEEDQALDKYIEALKLDPQRPTTHYNVGLIYKYRLQWAESFRYNNAAVELAPDDESANWNLAIAATALRDWRSARAAWQRLQIDVGEGEGPIAGDFGATPVRLRPHDEGEVVWAVRIDPVRARIESIPYPSSGFRHGDVVLHDGAAVGYRMLAGRERPVFNVLELFERSKYRTYEAEVEVKEPADIEALEKLCTASAIAFEDWTTNIQTLCKECSEGRPHEKHDYAHVEQWQPRHRVAFAATVDERLVREAIERWENGGRRLERFQ